MELSTFDLESMFTCVQTPTWMWAYFCITPVQPAEFSRTKCEELCTKFGVGPFSWLYPAYKRVPMGSTHAPDMAMSIMRHALVREAVADCLRLP